jgi:acyl-homoserine-lactone acylase
MRAIYSKWEDGKMVAKVGDCYVQIVEWSPEGKVSAQSIHQFGSSTNDQNSKFFKNQSKLFSEKKMKQVWSTIEDIKNNLYSSYNVTSHK